jgi:hypothetical protein
MYAPVVTIDCLFLFQIALPSEGNFIWGFPVFFVGIHLLALGYLQLWREANPVVLS